MNGAPSVFVENAIARGKNRRRRIFIEIIGACDRIKIPRVVGFIPKLVMTYICALWHPLVRCTFFVFSGPELHPQRDGI